MRPFIYERIADLSQAPRAGAGTGQGQVDATGQFLAGGTTLLDLMKLDVLRPTKVIDLNGIFNHAQTISIGSTGLRLGAFAKMAGAAEDKVVLSEFPVIAQSLQLAASAQLRNMATLGGNVLQKTRCSYYRDPTWAACNKRTPGSGCSAISGFNRNHGVLGVDASCISQYPGDFAVALIALDAQVEASGPHGLRHFPFSALHRSVAGQPHLETTLRSGETIVAFHVPAGPWTRHSIYVKVRDRASYEFAISSAAVALDMSGNIVSHVRIGLGGMAYRPWRSHQAEEFLIGKLLTEDSAMACAEVALRGAETHGNNDYKPALARRTIVRALLAAQELTVHQGAGHAG